MNQQEFLSRLREGISSLPPERIQEIEEDIFRHFDEGHGAGEDDDTLSEMLGDPSALALEYVSLYVSDGVSNAPAVPLQMQTDPPHFPPAPELESQDNFSPAPAERSAFARTGIALALGLLNIAVVLPLALALFITWIALAITSFALVFGGVIGFLASIIDLIVPTGFSSFFFNINGVHFPAVAFFGSIAMASFGGLLGMGLWPAGKSGLSLMERYTRWTIAAINGRHA